LSDIELEHIQKWNAVAQDSGFGNVAKQETQHDTKVRSSHELDVSQFNVSEKLIKAVAKVWSKNFLPRSVTVKPYKILFYGPGDHFQFHQDTPEENLCGTFLISLYQDCEPSRTFEIHQRGQPSKFWSSYGNGWCAFYPDIPHRVNTLTSGYRAILSFKIFAQEQVETPFTWSSDEIRKIELETLAEELQKLPGPVGLLLNHHYGYDSNSIYGCDKLLLDALRNRGFQVELKPILIHFSGQGPYPSPYGHDEYDYDDAYAKSRVYSITDDALDFVRERLSGATKSVEYNGEEIIFLDGESHGANGVWTDEEMQAIEYTGNESQPHSKESVYVRYAAIVRPIEADTVDIEAAGGMS